MSPAQINRLQAAWDFAAAEKRAGTDPAAIIAQLVGKYGAATQFSREPYTLRLAGHVASCTWSRDTGLLSNWLSSASLRLIRERQQ